MVRGWVKTSANMVSRCQNALQSHLSKPSKIASKKQNLDQKLYDSNLIFWMYLLIPDFLQKVSKTRKTSQKDPSLFNTVWLKKAHSFYKSQLTKHCKEYIPATQPKTLVIFTLIFQPTCFWLTCKKPLHCTISRSPRLHSRSTWKTNICFIYFSVRKVFVPET